MIDDKKNDYHALGMTLMNLGLKDSMRNYYLNDGGVDNAVL